MLATFPNWSDRAIAVHGNVSQPFVGQLRKAREQDHPGDHSDGGQLITLHSPAPSECPRVGLDGITRGPKHQAPTGVQADGWRSLPLVEFLDAPDYVWAALKMSKVKTAGELFDTIADGATLGLNAATVGDLLHELKQLPGFDGRLSEAAERKRKCKKAKAGKVGFDWKWIDGPFGAVVRAVDDAANHHPAWKGSPSFEECHQLLDQFKRVWDRAAEHLTKKGAA
jgi:hypothetical protein